jgi:hypothetical protein
LSELNNTTSKYINPPNFESIIRELKDYYKVINPRDLINLIIENMHQELKNPATKKIIQ